jgi:hypothetical protein
MDDEVQVRNSGGIAAQNFLNNGCNAIQFVSRLGLNLPLRKEAAPSLNRLVSLGCLHKMRSARTETNFRRRVLCCNSTENRFDLRKAVG